MLAELSNFARGSLLAPLFRKAQAAVPGMVPRCGGSPVTRLVRAFFFYEEASKANLFAELLRRFAYKAALMKLRYEGRG